MGQILHGSASTTHTVRALIQRSQASNAELSRTLGINVKTVAKWRKRGSVEDAQMGPKEVRSTVKRYHYDTHDQLKMHLSDFVDAYNYAQRLKTLKGLTPFEYICKIWRTDPERFKENPTHHKLGLNT